MDLLHFHTVKQNKAIATSGYNRLQIIGNLFGITAGLIFLWYLPLAVKVSGEYFRQLSSIIASHLFIFLLCNLIIIILYFNSVRFSGDSVAGSDPDAELYEEFIKNSTKSQSENQTPTQDSEEIVYQDKQIISVSDANPISRKCVDFDYPKEFRRTLSEGLNRECSEKYCGKLRRSETEIGRKDVSSSGENTLENPFEEDEMSNEEFQRTIEAFIDKQLRFHREESSAIVVHGQSS